MKKRNYHTYWLNRNRVASIFTFLLMLFAFQTLAQTVTIGTGTSSQRQPFGVFWGYERSASVYTSAEVNYSGLISTLYWSVATTQTASCPIKIYLKTDTSSTMNSDTWANIMANSTLVYSGSRSFSSSGWESFNLASPYYYNKFAGNLWVLVETNYTGTGTATYPYFYYHSASSQHEYWYADNTPPTGNGTVNASRPNIKISLSSYQNDAGISSIDSPVSPMIPGMNSIYLHLNNFGLDTLFSAKINWKVDNSSVTTYNWSDTLLTGMSSDLLYMGNYNFSNGYHTIKAWSSSPNGLLDSNAVNDTFIKNVIACNALSGTYYIGPSRNIKSFSDAISAMTYCGISGPVTFLVDTGTYAEQLIIPEITGASSVNSIVFESISGNSSEVVISHPSSSASTDNYTLFLDGVDYVTFKNITIERTGTNTYGTVLNLSNGATNNNFLGNTFRGVNLTSTSTNLSVVYSSATAIDSNNYFYQNAIENGSYAINMDGTSSTMERGNRFTDNVIDNFYYYGIRTEYQTKLEIDGNDITANKTTPYSTNYGIYLYYCDSGFSVEGNNLTLSGTSTNYLTYIYYCDGDSLSRGLIANNFISTTGGSGTNYGIYPYNSNYVDVFYNSVNINYGSVTGAKPIYPYASSSTGAYGNIRIMNNIFVNKAGGYAIDIAANAAVLGYVTLCDYNDLFTTGANVGHYNVTDATDLSAWQTASGFDANSISLDPGFKSETDLHLKRIGIDSMANPINGINVDIDGESRHASFPDIGADEYTPDSFDVSVVYIASIVQPACEGTYQVKARVRNTGYLDIDSVTVHWEVNGVGQTSYKFSNKIYSGFDTLLILGNYSFGYSQPYHIKAYPSGINYGIDGDAANDTAWLSNIVFHEIPSVPNVTDDTICNGQISTLTASGSPGSYVWYDSMTGGTQLDTGAVFKTKPLYSNKTYYVEAVNVALSASTILITELDMNTPDFVEIQNVGGNTVNTNGWKVLVSDNYTLINDINTIAWNLPASMSANQVLYKTDVTTDNYWGNNLYFSSGNTGWVMILDDNDEIVDFLSWGWDSTSLAAMSITYNSKTITLGNNWQGDGVNSTCTTSLNRIGTGDNNNAADFTCTTLSKGTTNSGLSLPFPGGGYLCSSTRVAVQVIVEPGPSVNVQGVNDSICETNMYQAFATAQNYASLSWTSNGDGSFDTNNILNPVYTPGSSDISNGQVVLTLSVHASSSCGGIVKDSVRVYIIKTPTSNAGSDATICSAIDFSLDGVATNAYNTEWMTTGDGSFVDAYALKTKYNLGTTDLSGGKIYLILKASSNHPCTLAVFDTLELTVAMGPVVNVGMDAVICENSSYQFAATAVNYNSIMWTSAGDGSFDNTSILDAKYSPGTNDINTGSVSLVLIGYGNPPCSITSDSMVLTINSLPTVDGGLDAKICENASVNLMATADNYSTLSWTSSGGGNFSIPNGLSTVFTPSLAEINAGSTHIMISVNGLNPCPSTYDSLLVEIAKFATVEAGLDGEICANESFQLNGSASTYSDLYWQTQTNGIFDNNKITNPVFSPGSDDVINAEVLIFLYVQSDPVCDYVYDSLLLTLKPLPATNLGNDTTLCAEQTIKLDAGAGYDKYRWSNNANVSSITVDSSWVGIGTAIYWVEVTDDGCTIRDTILITFKLCGGIKDELGDLSLKFYPNPTDGLLYLDLNGQSSDLKIEIRTIHGQIIHSQLLKAFSGQKSIEIDLLQQAKGIYFMKLSNKKGEAVIKLILE